MRQIKFNIWDTQENEMHEDVLCDIGQHDNFLDEVSCWEVCHDTKSTDKDKRFIWLQFTGLKDKNDKDIYEGDILRFVTTAEGGFMKAGIDVYKTVRFGRVCTNNNSLYVYEAFYVESQHSDGRDSIQYTLGHGALVVGNIYENPDLLNTK
jgi:uncharacterized phage protein (TIGR01671 family)